LIRKSGAGGTTLLMYDEAGHILGEYSASGALIQETVWMGDVPIATLQPNGASVAIYYVHTDHLGTPRKITRPSDNGLMWRWDPDTFGSVTPNTNPSGLGAFTYNLRFPAQYALNESGLFYNYFRDFDPQTGRYLESDPIGLKGGTFSTYTYVGGNPLSYLDPFGLTQCDIDVARYIAANATLRLSIGTPLLFPDSYGVGYLAPENGRTIRARTIPGKGTRLSDYYLQVLSYAKATELLNTVIHEAVHFTLPANDPLQSDDPGAGFPYSEAKRLTSSALIKKFNEERRTCGCAK
jgi:RHS repeat-associated protein